MSSEDREGLKLATELHRPIARAAALGGRNGAGLLIFGVLSVLFCLMDFDPAALAIGVVLLGTGFVERRASRRLAQADRSAPKTLARNELVLMAGIIAYSVLKLTVQRPTGETLSAVLGDTSGLGIDVGELAESLNRQIYVAFIAVTILYQGGMALYFLRRRAMVETFLRECPEWARQLVVGVSV